MFPRSIRSLLLATAIGLPTVAVLAAPSISCAEAGVYSVPSQDLGEALKALAAAAGHQIEFSPGAVKGKSSGAVVEAPTFSAALDAMLSGTGLNYTARDDGSVLVSNGAFKTGSTVSGLVVTGRRNQTAESIQLTSTNTTTVLTAQDLGRAPDQNVADSLSRVPGISVIEGGYPFTNGVSVDQAGRGEGNFVNIRGMDSEFNLNMINGVDVAQGLPYSREIQLSLLPPTGLQKVVVNKTLTADMDGDAIGGAIDFRTPTAYDFEGESHGSLTIGGNLSDRAIDYGLDSGGGSASFDYAHKFGDNDQLGIYFGGYYDRRSFANSIVDGIYPATANGQYTYAVQTKSGASAPGLDPASNLVLTGVDAGLTAGYEQRYGGNVSIDWRPSSTLSGYMRFTYAGDHVEQDTYYSQIYGNKISNTEIGTTGLYQPVIGDINPRFYYETNPEDAILSTYQVGGAGQFGRLHVAPQLFASYGENDEPNHIELSGRYNEVGAGMPYGGSSMFTYNNGAPIPILAPQQYAATTDIGDYEARRAGELTQDYSHQFRYGGKIDLSYDVDNGWLETIAAGVKYDDAYRHHTVRDYTTDSLYTTDANAPTLASQGYFSGSVGAIVPGTYNFSIPLVNQRALFNYFYQKVAAEGGLKALSDQCDSLYVNTYNCDTQSGTEATTSVYLMGTIKVGQVEIIPGFRFEHTDITNRYWDTPEDTNGNELPGYFTSDHTTYNKPLPSIQVNYRPSDFTVYRASIWTSYVAPSMFQLGGGEQVSNSDGGPANGGTTSITEGNPNLKTVDALNLDASGQWTNAHGGSATVAVFYKSLDHYIYDSINGFTNSGTPTVTSANGGFTSISKPENGGAAHLDGLELSGQQKFKDLPAPFDGIGVSGNVTLEHSSVNTESPGLSSNERITNQPDVAANGQVFYEKGPYQFALSYRYTGDYVAAYGTFGGSSSLDTWVHANEQVDLHMGYVTPWGVKLDAAISNLLDADTYVASIGRTSNVIPSFVDTGRIYTFHVGYSF